MKDKNQQHTPAEENEGYSRRSVLKLLSASGAAVGLDRLLPSAWISPQVSDSEEPVPDALDIPPIQIRNLTFQWNASFFHNNQTWANGSARFEYFSNVVNVSDSTGIFAVLESQGAFSQGGPIYNIGGVVIPFVSSFVTGNISLPLPGYFPRNQWDGLAVMLREHVTPPLDSNRLAERFIPGNGPLIADLAGKACTPKVVGGVLYCTYHIGFKYYDEEGAISETSSISVAHGDEVLLSDATLGRLGIFPADKYKGVIDLLVDIPEGNEGQLRVILWNDNNNPSNVLTSPRSFVSECPQKLELNINRSAAQFVPNSTAKYQVRFQYNDSAGILSAAALLSASLANGPVIYNGVPLSSAEGDIQVLDFYNTIINGTHGCPSVVINSTLGTGYFHVNLPGVTRLAVQADEDLNWFLGDPNDGRTSNTVNTTLLDPTAVTLEELSAKPHKTGLAAAAAAAAALGAATLAARLNKTDQASEETSSGE